MTIYFLGFGGEDGACEMWKEERTFDTEDQYLQYVHDLRYRLAKYKYGGAKIIRGIIVREIASWKDDYQRIIDTYQLSPEEDVYLSDLVSAWAANET